MRTDIAKLPGQREAIDKAVAEQGLKDLKKLLPQTEEGWIQLFVLSGVAVLGGVSGAVVNNPNASANFNAWRNVFFEPIPPNHVTDISTVGAQVTDCAGVGFQEGFSVGERRDGELVVLDKQGKVLGPLGNGICPNEVIVKVGYHELKPKVSDHAWVFSAENGDKRWSGIVKHGFADK